MIGKAKYIPNGGGGGRFSGLEAKFNPNQPRDDGGKWTDSGGGGGGGKGGKKGSGGKGKLSGEAWAESVSKREERALLAWEGEKDNGENDDGVQRKKLIAAMKDPKNSPAKWVRQAEVFEEMIDRAEPTPGDYVSNLSIPFTPKGEYVPNYNIPEENLDAVVASFKPGSTFEFGHAAPLNKRGHRWEDMGSSDVRDANSIPVKYFIRSKNGVDLKPLLDKDDKGDQRLMDYGQAVEPRKSKFKVERVRNPNPDTRQVRQSNDVNSWKNIKPIEVHLQAI
jgi:hypothetical protein